MAAVPLTDLVDAPATPAPTPPALVSTARSIRSALVTFRHGVGDPTTRLTRPGPVGEFRRATWTPDGPGTIRLTWTPVDGDDPAERPADAPDGAPRCSLAVETWGPGGGWLVDRAAGLAGLDDPGDPSLGDAPHLAVARAARDHRHLRMGRSGDLYHELLPTIIEQRITAGEAVRQWARLCRELGGPAPGPFADLLVPPAPTVLRRQPTWWFHPLGIERSRASTLVEVARHASKYWEWSELAPTETARRLQLLRGVGVWTTGTALGPALGDPDALCIGDYHAKNIVAWAVHGRPRGTDAEMLESLEPYAGQRGRVLRLLTAAGHSAPKFGPRRRILPMARW